MSKHPILGVPLDILTPRELDRKIRHLVYRRRAHIVTPNPEFLLLAQKNQEFFSVLRRADLAVPDGIGLKFAAWLKGVNLRRYTGSNLVQELLDLALQKRWRVAVINWRGGLSTDAEIQHALEKTYPRLKVLVFSVERDGQGYHAGRLRGFNPDLVFVAIGAPWQDLLIRNRILTDVPSVRLAMGVGASFDFLTGRQKRAPRFFQVLGLEWLWRLILQPSRIQRIWNAVAIFSWKVIAWEFRRFAYRRNVVALIINRFNETLILNSAGRGSYWSLPQGGVERGESLEEGLRREVEEETGLRDLEIIGRWENVFQYDWPKHYTHSGYRGQRQSLFVMRFSGNPKAVRTNPSEHKGYRWVKLERLRNEASRVHDRQYSIFLEKYKELNNGKR